MTVQITVQPALSKQKHMDTDALDMTTETSAQTDTMGVEGVTANEVAWRFVQDYYTYMNKSPDRLYCFYGHDSQMIAGTEGIVGDTIEGKQNIRDALTAYQYNNCKVFVLNVDSQKSADNGILVFVAGRLTNDNDATERKFSQTFFLAPQPNGYYVLNDILRFETDISKQDTLDGEQPCDMTHEPQPVVSGWDLPEQHEETSEWQSTAQTLNAETLEKLKLQLNADDAAETQRRGSMSSDSKAAKSWATLAETGRERWGKAAMQSAATVIQVAASEAPAAPAPAYARRQHDDGPTAFVSGPLDETNEQELTQLFSACGPVLRVHVAANHRYAFIRFETAESLQAALGQSFVLPSGAALTVNERRANEHRRESGSGGGRFATRGRGAGDRRFSRGGRGHYRS